MNSGDGKNSACGGKNPGCRVDERGASACDGW
jgi:hypothetical protein